MILITNLNNKFCLIYIERRQKGRFAGFSLYVSRNGYIQSSTLCYKDGPELPPLNFTTTCIEYGRYIIYYNERLNGVSYPKDYEVTNVFTELCEVSVNGKQFLIGYAYKPNFVYILEYN